MAGDGNRLLLVSTWIVENVPMIPPPKLIGVMRPVPVKLRQSSCSTDDPSSVNVPLELPKCS
ncbi:MAG TPA: hypothetical protein VGP72_20650 [Planctomycetota bacterium]|jgi:hypothetical protein